MDTIIRKNGIGIGKLSINFIKLQGLNQDEVDELKELHVSLHDLQNTIKGTELTEPERLDYIESVQGIEFDMQETWGFEKDAKKHNHWFQDPNCGCPKLDNLDRIGCNRVYSAGCRIHGVPIEGNDEK